jgi:hypothetical protein
MSIDIIARKQKKLVYVDNKIVGSIENNRFIKEVRGSKHKLRRPQAWAIDAEAFDSEIKPNTTDIIIFDKETSTEYHCTTETFANHCFKFNRGYGNQYGLTLKHFNKGNESNQSNESNKQLALFEVD